MSTNDFEECWGKGVSQDDDMSMFIDSEDESKGNTKEEQEVGINCCGDDSDDNEDTGTFFKFKPEKIEVTNGLDDDGWLYQDDETLEDIEKYSDKEVFGDDDITDDWDNEEITDDTDEESEAGAEENDMSEVLSKLFADDTGNTCYKSKNQKRVRQERAIETYMNLVRKNLSKEEAINILYGEDSITDCLVRLFGEAVLREVVSD